MRILNFFRRGASAPLARERLQILLSHERVAGSQPDLLAILQAMKSAGALHAEIEVI